MRPSVPDVHITDSQDAELAAYRALCGQAVLGLIFGLLAPLAMVDPMLWSVPLLGSLLSIGALRRIKRLAPELTGRKMALGGLALSLVFLTAAPANWLAYRKMVRDEARQFSALWFKYLTHDEPQKAHQLTVAPQSRQPLDENLWAVYRAVPRLREELENYVNAPLTRTLLALGPKARVRFYQAADQAHQNDMNRVDQWYAVTYEEEGERKSFFVRVGAMRTKLKGGRAGWRIVLTAGGGRPDGW
jgi:hypothetical protein